MPELITKQDQRLEQWLYNNGFVRGNPFKLSAAENENYLETVFYDTGEQERIYGDPAQPQTVLFFAGRGCGKTAQRRMVEAKSSPRKASSNILAFTYDLAEWRNIDNNSIPTQTQYIISFVKQGLETFLTALSIPGNPKITRLDEELIEEIAKIGWKLTPDLFSTFVIAQKLKNSWSHLGISFSDIKNAVNDIQIEQLLHDRSLGNSDDLLLAKLYDYIMQAKKERMDPISPYDGLKKLLQIISEFDFNAIYILFDGLDEVAIEHSEKDCLDYLKPLLADLELLRLNSLAFKFFIPLHLRAALFSKEWFRPDKLATCLMSLSWTPEQLKELLNYRLRAFHSGDNGLNALESICEPELATDIIEQLVIQARGVPRNMILLGQKLLTKKNKDADWLSLDDWKKTQHEFIRSPEFICPELEIGEKFVYLMGQQLHLTFDQVQFLNCLAQNGGAANKEQLAERLYQSRDIVASDQQLSALVKRLRKVLNDDVKNPIYIFTANRQGFILKHWRAIDN